MWATRACGYVVLLDAAPFGISDCASFELTSWPNVLARQQLTSGHYIVLGDGRMMHRICLLANDPGVPLACVVPRDHMAALRYRASACFDGLIVDRTDSSATCLPRPTKFQRHRLQLLLDVLDLAMTPGDKSLTTHELALRRIYPGMTVGQGAEWKSSSHRRRTQRLIAEARAMMNGGYQVLLAGGEGRQKQRLLSAAPALSSLPP